MVSFKTLWDNHPGLSVKPCDETYFANQCAIRMGVALQESNIDLSSFSGAKCYPGLEHEPKHILRAQELADWMSLNSEFGKVKILKKSDYKDERAYYIFFQLNSFFRKGIIFIKDGWGSTDHIDLWDGMHMKMKGGELEYLYRGREFWFWEMV